jgi:hypothetical protein
MRELPTRLAAKQGGRIKIEPAPKSAKATKRGR